MGWMPLFNNKIKITKLLNNNMHSKSEQLTVREDKNKSFLESTENKKFEKLNSRGKNIK